ncbi:MAG TPA: hypothetical protein VMR73_02525 [Candidatus Paceibacterota bacterium]|nr:hypothetical protein [Candidatus Paceibacterota bacterium]
MKNATFADVPIGEFFIARFDSGLNGLFKRIPRTFQRINRRINMANAINLWEKNPSDTYFYHFNGDVKIQMTDMNGESIQRYLFENTTQLDEVFRTRPIGEEEKAIIALVSKLKRTNVDTIIRRLKGRFKPSKIEQSVEMLINQERLSFDNRWNIINKPA